MTECSQKCRCGVFHILVIKSDILLSLVTVTFGFVISVSLYIFYAVYMYTKFNMAVLGDCIFISLVTSLDDVVSKLMYVCKWKERRLSLCRDHSTI